MCPDERRVIDTVFALSSILTPFMLGSVVGAIASGRVPVGNAAGNLVTSWLNPTSILSAPGRRGRCVPRRRLPGRRRPPPRCRPSWQRAFRARSLAAGVAGRRPGRGRSDRRSPRRRAHLPRTHRRLGTGGGHRLRPRRSHHTRPGLAQPVSAGPRQRRPRRRGDPRSAGPPRNARSCCPA